MTLKIENEIEDLRDKLYNMISAKDIITNDEEILSLSKDLDNLINIFVNKK
jgi:hypothetical protein